jgi:hypothetical protein
LNSKGKKKLFIIIPLFLTVLLATAVIFTGCVRGMSPIGWSGVAIKNNVLFAGSKEGTLVSVNLNTNPSTILAADPLRSASTGGTGCSSTSSSGSACGGAPPAVAYMVLPAFSGDLL